ncbi:alpha/beta hydrolase family protein [Paenibacillus sp. TRM 82003]|nr:alpha/beta hydrolase family protein [Paenibacillus sp. TRM 82003]
MERKIVYMMEANVQAYMSSLIRAKGRLAFREDAPWESWRDALAGRLRELLGDVPSQPAEPNPETIEEVRCDGYVRQRVVITTIEGLRMPMYVLLPEGGGGPAPVVVALHGHGYGSREIVGLEPDGSERQGDPGLHKDFAVSLAKRGFVVAAPELLGFGDRRFEEDAKQGPKANSCFRLAAHLMMMGSTLPGYRMYEVMRAIDYIASRPEAKADRIGCMGISGGGLVAAFAAALDPRLRASVISGYANTFQGSILDRNHCLDNYVPGILHECEMPDVLGLLAPRPLLIESGSEDRVFPIRPAKEAYAALERIYRKAGAPDSLAADFFEGGHEISGAAAYDWLAQQLT